MNRISANPLVLFRVLILLSLMIYSRLAVADCLEADQHCAEVGKWHLSLSLGAGALSNPLHGGDDIPLIIIPHLYYYGENLFIENNVLGYSFIQGDNIIVSAISQLNREKAFFTDWQPTHLFTPQFSEIAFEGPIERSVSKDDISKRKWAIDAGIQINWFIRETTELKAQLLHDINSVYQGFNAQLSINHTLNFGKAEQHTIHLGLGIDWQSSKLADYYYGLDSSDNVDLYNYYHADSGITPFISVKYSYHLSEHWQLSLYAKQLWLGEHITDSPLIKEQQVTSGFVGVMYAF